MRFLAFSEPTNEGEIPRLRYDPSKGASQPPPPLTLVAVQETCSFLSITFSVFPCLVTMTKIFYPLSPEVYCGDYAAKASSSGRLRPSTGSMLLWTMDFQGFKVSRPGPG